MGQFRALALEVALLVLSPPSFGSSPSSRLKLVKESQVSIETTPINQLLARAGPQSQPDSDPLQLILL